jgi:hypothetical protein
MDKEQIKQEFKMLILSDVTVNKVWETYKHGDIESYVEALRYMVVLLAREKRDFSQRLLDIAFREPIDKIKIEDILSY